VACPKCKPYGPCVEHEGGTAERDALQAELEQMHGVHSALNSELDSVIAERDALRARVAELEAALRPLAALDVYRTHGANFHMNCELAPLVAAARGVLGTEPE
jgi:predicted nuclease with TOPRIM domain